ncbi:MAG: three-Cys-motif partner protein TcmP [Terracidiphilus sp.]|jgi:three-Cys-motif partner protein
MDQSFFDESREQSIIKARIIAKYFWAWAKVIIPTAKQHDKRIAYIDLFAGPGRYKDGTISTPLKILEQAIADPDMSQMLVTLFNDKDAENARDLERAVGELPGIEGMKYKPQIANQEVGTEIVQLFKSMRMVPTFFFVDPWGYKGLSLGLINSVLKNWGCDCIFFFNYNRVNMGLPNEAVRDHINVLFGEERADQVREKLKGLNPEEREILIVEELSEALKEMGGKFVLPFTFRNERGSRTTHHLIYVSKAFRGYEIMKGIMALESSEADQGVPSFQYCPASERFPLLFNLTTPLEDLEKELLHKFAGKTVAMHDIYLQHNVGRPFISRNYKRALSNLESAGKVRADPPAGKRRMQKGERTFPDHVNVTFPKEVHGEC